MSKEVLENLKAGIRTFRTDVYPLHKDKYIRAAATQQTPSTLIVACADSRIDVETITNSSPGEVFITRNIGNMVPPYGEMLGGVSAVIEYAVAALGVRHIVVCGHSDCGAMKGLQNLSSVAKLPTVENWLKNAHAALSVVRAIGETEDKTLELRRLTEQNVLLQIQHLQTHPSVAGAIARGELSISGWVYEIGSGEVRIAENRANVFVPVKVGDIP
jgi:carbonic anhydrase